MKLEHRTERVIPVNKFAYRIARYTLFSAGLIIISLGIGIAGYMLFAGLNFTDSFYMASMILTGMGPAFEMQDDAAKYFSSFYALYSGVAFLSTTAVFLAPSVHRLLHILHVENNKEDKSIE